MQPITCDACRQPTVGHDVVNYGSMEGGYRQLCGRCFNEAAASRLGLQGFEHVVFEPVHMVDARGAKHEFQFRTRLFGPGLAIDAFELRDGCPSGYEFQVIGEPDDDPLELLGKLIGKMRRGLGSHASGGHRPRAAGERSPDLAWHCRQRSRQGPSCTHGRHRWARDLLGRTGAAW